MGKVIKRTYLRGCIFCRLLSYKVIGKAPIPSSNLHAYYELTLTHRHGWMGERQSLPQDAAVYISEQGENDHGFE